MVSEFNFLFAAVSDGRWHWGLGDPDLGAVVVTGLYLLITVVCLVVSRQLWRDAVLPFSPATQLLPRNQVRRMNGEARTWLLLAVLLFLLGINKQGDFQSLLTLYGRDILRQAGLYEVRHKIQVVFIIGFTVAAATSVVAYLWLVRRFPWPCRVAAFGLGLQVTFIVIRAASFHHVGYLLAQRMGNLKLNLLLESIGLLVILLAATFRWAAERAKQVVSPEKVSSS